MRGFEVISTYPPNTINLPKRATEDSAGYDFESAEEVVIPVGGTALVKTGVKVYMNKNEYLQVQIRSSLAKDGGLMLHNSVGIVDADYADNPKNEGEVMFLLYNAGRYDYKIEKGQRIGQGIFLPYLTVDDEVKVVKKREGGMGSSGK